VLRWAVYEAGKAAAQRLPQDHPGFTERTTRRWARPAEPDPERFGAAAGWAGRADSHAQIVYFCVPGGIIGDSR